MVKVGQGAPHDETQAGMIELLQAATAEMERLVTMTQDAVLELYEVVLATSGGDEDG